MKKKITVLAIVIILPLLLYSAFLYAGKILIPKKVHYHAGFIVFHNDKKLNFSDFKYMLVKPCLLNKKNNDLEDLQVEKAHLHDSVGDVVHIEAKGAKWKDLFANIKYPIDSKNTSAYTNGRKIENFLDAAIMPNESIVVFTGTNNIKSHLAEQISTNYIEGKAKKSQSCSD